MAASRRQFRGDWRLVACGLIIDVGETMNEEKMDVDVCRGYCPVQVTLRLISGKWKVVVLYHLFDGKKRFSELMRFAGHVSQRTLTMQLRELERDGIIRRTVYAEVPPRVEYELTPLGETMRPIVESMRAWGMWYKEKLGVRNEG